MKENLELFIRSNVKNPNEDEVKAILDIFQPQQFSKGDLFKRHSDICQKLGFLIKGKTRHFVIKENGDEVTGRIVQKNNFVTDFIGIRTQEKTPLTIEFLEPSFMLVASTEAMKNLLEVNLTLNILIREYIADNTVKLGKLHFLFLAGTARQRYKYVSENHPELLKKTPLRFIASMIGITPSHLSRIRNKIRK